jgi:IS30 family transposase
MTYRQITYIERYSLGLLRRQGLCPAAIARVLGRHRSSILRELRRNRARSDGTYRPPLASASAIEPRRSAMSPDAQCCSSKLISGGVLGPSRGSRVRARVGSHELQRGHRSS